MASIEDRVRKIVMEQLALDADKIPDNKASFVDDLGLDSLETVELIMDLEEAFGIEIPDKDAQQISSLQEMIDYIVEKVEKVEKD